ncbi:hypothetical protein [Kitasatospora sp. NPDC096204]
MLPSTVLAELAEVVGEWFEGEPEYYIAPTTDRYQYGPTNPDNTV